MARSKRFFRQHKARPRLNSSRETRPHSEVRDRRTLSPLRISLTYAAAACIWIFL
jgi:hypothetical protein